RRPQPAGGRARAAWCGAARHAERPNAAVERQCASTRDARTCRGGAREIAATAMRQPRLFEFRMGERSPDTLVVAEANRDAAKLLTDWRTWPNGALALSGPSGAGKTHLALAWALEAGARQVSSTAAPDDAAAIFRESEGRLFIDDADG